MKIICEKGYHAGNVLRLVAEYLEKRYPDDMILDENMEITLSLKNGENGQPIVLGEEELQLSHHTADHSEDYYNHDVLTHLYTRCKYEARPQGLSAGELCAADLHLYGCRRPA